MIPDAEILARLPPDTPITVQVPAGALLKAMAGTVRGAATLTTREAARTFGWTPADWQRWAREDSEASQYPADIPCPVFEGRGWRLPREWCDAVYRRKMKMDRKPNATATPHQLRHNHGPRKHRPREAAPPAAPRRIEALP